MITSCKRCVLDNTDSVYFEINSETGICNFCEDFESEWVKRDSDKLTRKLNHLVGKIKEQKGKYNCLLGVSGGVDSSYLAYWAKEQGLRPLVVHLDNGWNSELAVENISRICQKQEFDYKTIVIDWNEFKQMQVAYLNAGVIDIEVLSDHAIYATMHKLAKKHKLKYIVSGFNMATEGIMPKDWVYNKLDWVNIKDIVTRHSNLSKFVSYPHVTFAKNLIYNLFNKLTVVQPLNLMNYNKVEAKQHLISYFDWRDYGGKHYESVFTKFYQAYILPEKFKKDKRKVHLATLINSGQITREEALLELEKPLYDLSELAQEKEYVLKKLNLSNAEFDKVMLSKPNKHTDFKTDKTYWDRYFKVIKLLKFWS